MGVLLTAVLAGLLSKEEALNNLEEMLKQGIRISSRLQNWLREELDRLQ
jgi:ribosome assembly protein YihI (activator of Der GTPase)